MNNDLDYRTKLITYDKSTEISYIHNDITLEPYTYIHNVGHRINKIQLDFTTSKLIPAWTALLSFKNVLANGIHYGYSYQNSNIYFIYHNNEYIVSANSIPANIRIRIVIISMQ